MLYNISTVAEVERLVTLYNTKTPSIEDCMSEAVESLVKLYNTKTVSVS